MIAGGAFANTGYQLDVPITHPDQVREIEQQLSAKNGGKHVLITNFIKFENEPEPEGGAVS